MIDFCLKPFEWQKNMDIVMQNVNLNSIEYLSVRTILVNFSNSYNGDIYKKILCHNVWKFSEENIIEKGEGFPTFICDIRVAKLATAEIIAAFDYLNYGWGIPESDEYYLVCIDGGEMSIILICDNIEILDI